MSEKPDPYYARPDSHPRNCTCYSCNEGRQGWRFRESQAQRSTSRRPPRRKSSPPEWGSSPTVHIPSYRRRRILKRFAKFLVWVCPIAITVLIVIWVSGNEALRSQVLDWIDDQSIPEMFTRSALHTPTLDSQQRDRFSSVPPHLKHMEHKLQMLELVNAERERAGVPAVVLGENAAAQMPAEASLENCSSSHWGPDGLKPYMRYSLAGEYQANGENGHGLNYCSQIHRLDTNEGLVGASIKAGYDGK